MRALLNNLPDRLSLLLAPWPGLLLGLLVLHAPEWTQAMTIGVGTAVLQTLVNDGLMLLRAWPLWCLLCLPLTGLSAWSRTWALGLLGSVWLLVQLGLSQYFLMSGVPLGADLFGYTLTEIRTTVVAGVASAPPTSALVALVLALVAFWGGLVWQHRRPVLVFPAAATAGLLALSLVGSATMPWYWPAPASGVAPPTVNKLAYFVSDVLDKRLHSAPVASIKGAYPFAHAETTPDTLGPLFALEPKAKPDLLLIVVAGLGRSFSGPGARLGSFTPFLDELAARSLYWANFLATQGRTFAVLPSVLASLPFGSDNALLPPHDNLPKLLGQQGYSLRYFSGSNLTFDHQGDYLRQSGVQALWSEKDFPNPDRRLSEWGYADGDLLQAVGNASAPVSPVFTLVQTMSMHTPFVVPDQETYRRKVDARLDQLGIAAARREPYHRQRDIYASVLYTDDALRRFFLQLEQSPRWRNTIVIITGDHRLPEIPMDTRLERYHVPLIVASPLLRQPRRIRALSSHFDIAPALLAMLSRQYGVQTPLQTHWMGTGLDTAVEWRNLHSLPLKQTKTDLDDYVSGTHYLGQDRLYTLSDGLQPEPAADPVVHERLRKEFASVRTHLATVNRAQALVPESSLSERRGYNAATRTLEPQDRAAHLAGVVASGAQAQQLANGRVQAQGVFTQHGAEHAPVFVPLFVLTDAQGQQIVEGYGKAMKLQAGQATTVSLKLQTSDLPPGPLYLAVVVSHPDTGKSIGQGQYHVQVQR